MHIRLRKYIFLLMCAVVGLQLQAQTVYHQYIQQYAPMAQDQMRRYGIPASITLAQGLLESGAGRSKLAREANNHFGIKVGMNWTGPYMVVADDRPDDKFRVYDSAADSYEDHSIFLRNGRRYASLFDLKSTDYKGWAYGLKKAGYATSPTYAQSLVNMIEKFNLHEYDKEKREHHRRHHDNEGQKAKIEEKTFADAHSIRRCNGQYYVVARQGDTYASLAHALKLKEKNLRKYNDVDNSRQLSAGDIVYLGKKRKKADPTMKRRYHVMEAGESLYSISQRFGIRLTSLCKMNPISSGYHFKVGDEIRIK